MIHVSQHLQFFSCPCSDTEEDFHLLLPIHASFLTHVPYKTCRVYHNKKMLPFQIPVEKYQCEWDQWFLVLMSQVIIYSIS